MQFLIKWNIPTNCCLCAPQRIARVFSELKAVASRKAVHVREAHCDGNAGHCRTVMIGSSKEISELAKTPEIEVLVWANAEQRSISMEKCASWHSYGLCKIANLETRFDTMLVEEVIRPSYQTLLRRCGYCGERVVVRAH